jgi:hypothetical protein
MYSPAAAALEHPGRAGEEADLVDHRRDLLVHGQLERLAGVLALGGDELLGPGLDGVGDAERARLRSDGVVSRQASRRPPPPPAGPVDVGRARHRRLGEGLAGARVDQGGSGPSSASR